MDARYCTLSRVSFGLNAGGAGAGLERQPAIALRLHSIRPGGSPLAPWLNSRPGGSTLVLVAQPRLSSPRWLNSPPAWLNSRTPGRRRRLAASHWPWAFSPGALATVSDQTRPQRRCRRDRRAAGGGPELARAAGGLRRAVYYSLSPGRRRRSATSQLALDVQSGLLAFGPDQTRPQRHCRRDRRAVGGGPGLARIAGVSPDAS